MSPTYAFVCNPERPDLVGLWCEFCGLVSWNDMDVAQLYCAACCTFHGDLHRDLAMIDGAVAAGRIAPTDADTLRGLVYPQFHDERLTP